ncbi:MAG: hypothetical protein ACTSQK_11935 [Candidatus Heimdallarchaeota archaeon]
MPNIITRAADSTKYLIFCHNFNDQPAPGDSIFLPWSDAGESSSSGTDTYLIAPFDITFLTMDYATDDIANGFTGTLVLGSRDQGAGSSTTLGSESIAYSNVEDHNTKRYGDSWTGTRVVTKGNKAYFHYTWDITPKASGTDHMFTSVWTMDINT